MRFVVRRHSVAKMLTVCFCVLILLLQLVFSHHIPSTPCPGIFDYGSDGTTVYGVVRLRPTEPVSTLVLRTNFTVGVQLFSDYVGHIEAYDGTHLLQRYNKGTPVQFRIHFPVTSPLPRITALSVNGHILCEGPPEIPLPGQYVTTISLQHTSYPIGGGGGHVFNTIPQSQRWGDDAEVHVVTFNDIEFNQNRDNNNKPLHIINNTPIYNQSPTPVYEQSTRPFHVQPTIRPVADQRPPIRRPTPTPTPRPSNPITSSYRPQISVTVTSRPTQSFFQNPNAFGCGQVVGGNENVPLIYNGEAYTRGDIPWLVAIYKGKAGTLNFICGGTLVSDRHVVTAAHCMHRRSELTSIKDFVVKVGVHDLNAWSDEYTVTRNIAAASIHESYNASTLDNDLLVFTFNKRVEFNNYIRPACLWGGEADLGLVVGASGVVAGWGDQGNPDLIGQGVPHMVHLPIVSNAQCKASKTHFHYITSSKTLCAGDRRGAGPCRGDSGGGLYLLDGGKWRLRGVVSRSLRSPTGDAVCNLNEYIVFTDTAQYTDWIKSIISGNNNYND